MTIDRTIPPEEDVFLKIYLRLIQEKTFSNEEKMSLGLRLDNAYLVYQECARLLRSTLPCTEESRGKIILLRDEALQFLQVVLNVEEVKDILLLMQDRIKKSQYNLEYIPGKSPSSLTHLFSPEAANSKAQYNFRKLAVMGLAQSRQKIMSLSEEMRKYDKENDIKMLKPEERDIYRVLIHDHKFVMRTLERGKNTFSFCDTSHMITHGNVGFAAITINLQGEISIFNHLNKLNKVAHSTMNAGSSVLFAGEIQIKNGLPIALTTYSGHYKPNLLNIYETLNFFVKQGIDISQIEVQLFYKITPSLPLRLLKEGSNLNKNLFHNEKVAYVYNAEEIFELGYERIKAAYLPRVPDETKENNEILYNNKTNNIKFS